MPVQRPLSPHLQVYRPQITSTLSILHRITGLLLCLGALLLVAWIATTAAGPEWHDCYFHFVDSLFGRLILLGLVFSLLFHLCNGIRHLIWDMGYGFDLSTTTASGWTVVALSVLGTLYAAFRLFGGAP
jgi:succinate dehydrogenase / fumarate reductase, cytochrome b subunit